MKKVFLVFLILFALLFPAQVVYGDPDGKNNNETQTQTGKNSNPNVQITNPLGPIDSPNALIGKIINSVLGLVGSLALIMFVYGGLIWMTSSGSQEKVKKGKDTVVWAIIGLAIVFFSYGLIRFLISSLN